MGKKSDIVQLKAAAKHLHNFELSKLPSRILVDLEAANESDILALVDIIRLTKAWSKSYGPFPGNIMGDLRRAVSYGHWDEVRKIKERFEGFTEAFDSEWALEFAISEVTHGHFNETIEICQKIINDPDAVSVTRGSAYQVLGHAQFELGCLQEADEALANAKEIASAIDNFHGVIAANNFKILMSSDSKDISDYINESYENLKLFPSFRWLISILRSSAQIHALLGDGERAQRDYIFAYLLTRSLGDELYSVRSLLELLFITGGKDDLLVSKLEKIETENVTVGQWLRAFKGKSVDSFGLLGRFLETRPSYSPSFDVADIQASRWDWVVYRDGGLIADLKDEKLHFIGGSSPLVQVLQCLFENGFSVSEEKLFTTVWKLRWVAEKNRSLVKVTLSRLRRLLPYCKIQYSSGRISLKNPGIFL